RTRFILGADNEPRQVVEQAAAVAIESIDLSKERTGEQTAREHLQPMPSPPSDLTQSPLRVALLRLATEDHLLAVATHHTATDRWSQAVFVRELSVLYRAAVLDEAAPLPELPVQYADWALWQRDSLQGEALQRQLDYWTTHLAGELPLLDLPFDRPRGATASFRGAHYAFTLDRALSVRLRDVAKQRGVSLFTLLLTTYKALIQRYTSTDDILVGI